MTGMDAPAEKAGLESEIDMGTSWDTGKLVGVFSTDTDVQAASVKVDKIKTRLFIEFLTGIVITNELFFISKGLQAKRWSSIDQENLNENIGSHENERLFLYRRA